MRGNLVWFLDSNLNFVPDEEGHFKCMLNGKIIPYHKSVVEQMMDMNGSRGVPQNPLVRDGIEMAQEGLKMYDKFKEKQQAKQEDKIREEIKAIEKKHHDDVEKINNDYLHKIHDLKNKATQESNTEKEYVIEVFKTKVGGVLFYNNAKYGFSDTYSEAGQTEAWTLAHFLRHEDKYDIHSVKRKSDSQEFTVGDETNYGVIGLFFILDGKTLIQQDKTVGETFGGVPLSSLTKKKDNAVMVDMDAPLLSVRDVVDLALPNSMESGHGIFAVSKTELIELAAQKMKQ